ncbi:SGNH/GDSL hydrolase family protein [Haoranjiania flava]|uniref:GDSL-type esterase/lipase family protein n=1 Tax=Haoranjiania flava TaxID=1856322 RepID=A0AAE3IMT1_9BACT|nr:GDSL-type esterase/lipase family protein [Haoranjiania flava]MCU7694779.1 GDSL-type esterase/lipase family protein [Haoranjiania flava]
MKKALFIAFAALLYLSVKAQPAKTSGYLAEIKEELKAVFPKNRTINLVFHGHSVPTGYWSKSKVHTLESYPHLLLKKLKAEYPYAVINIITTSIGGEWAEKGQKRFAKDVLPHKPDVIFIDYALNDVGIGLERSEAAWSKMIEEALANQIKVILVTTSPDQRQDITDPENVLTKHAEQIRWLAAKYHVGLADPFAEFQKVMQKKGSVKKYMSHVNHPNKKGHDIIASQLFTWFR